MEDKKYTIMKEGRAMEPLVHKYNKRKKGFMQIELKEYEDEEAEVEIKLEEEKEKE